MELNAPEVNAPETPRAHSVRCLEAAQRLDALRETMPRRPWRHQVEAEWDELRKALQWAIGKQGNILLGQRLVGALETAWWALPDAEAQYWIRTAFESADEMTPRNVRARLNLALARLRVQHHRFKSAHVAAERALQRAREVNDDVGVARAQFLSGHSLVVQGDLAEGERLLEAALVGFRKLGARRSIGRTLASLALAREYAGDIVTACALCSDSVDIFRSIEGDEGDPEHLAYLGELEFHAGNVEEALRLASEALERHRKTHDRTKTLVDLNNKSAYLLALGRVEEARRDAGEALKLGAGEQDSLWTAVALQHLAAAEALQGDQTRAARLLGFVDRKLIQLEHQREYTEEQERRHVVDVLQKKFQNGEMDRLMTEGRTWAEDHAVAEALTV